MISFNAEYFCIWGQGKWHKIPVVRLSKQNYGAGTVIPVIPVVPENYVPQGTTILFADLVNI
jgi:hypothetical protein